MSSWPKYSSQGDEWREPGIKRGSHGALIKQQRHRAPASSVSLQQAELSNYSVKMNIGPLICFLFQPALKLDQNRLLMPRARPRAFPVCSPCSKSSSPEDQFPQHVRPHSSQLCRVWPQAQLGQCHYSVLLQVSLATGSVARPFPMMAFSSKLIHRFCHAVRPMVSSLLF